MASWGELGFCTTDTHIEPGRVVRCRQRLDDIPNQPCGEAIAVGTLGHWPDQAGCHRLIQQGEDLCAPRLAVTHYFTGVEYRSPGSYQRQHCSTLCTHGGQLRTHGFDHAGGDSLHCRGQMRPLLHVVHQGVQHLGHKERASATGDEDFADDLVVGQTKVQRIRYADNETNYCPRCQTGGKLLADRALSRLLKRDWPKSIDELERMNL